MGNRDYKEFAKGGFYHIYNRGNNKENIFIDSQDYQAFLFRLGLSLGFNTQEMSFCDILSHSNSRVRINGKPLLFRLHAFCLMPNHYHLLIEQLENVPVSDLILKTCTSFSMYFNKKYDRVGHVFQDRFKCVNTSSNQQLMWTNAYIHMNPVISKIAIRPEKYKWSSCMDFMESRENPILYKDMLLNIFGSREKFLKETLSYYKKGQFVSMSRAPLGF